MSQNKGVADYPHKDILEKLWRSGLRQKGILEYLSENNLPPISGKALAKYGQRNWSDAADEIKNKNASIALDIKDSEAYGIIEKTIKEVADKNLGTVERFSVSKTGFNISFKPQQKSEEIDLPTIPKTKPALFNVTVKSAIDYHVVIPDTQVEPGRPTDHLLWISQYLYDNFHGQKIKLIHLGDHWNMGSLSSYDKGTGKMEGRRYVADIESGNRAFEVLDSKIEKEPWDKHLLRGNHEERISRAAINNIQLDGLITMDHCLAPATWEIHDFLEPVEIDGIVYSHYFYNPNNGRPYSGSIETRLNVLGHSFVMGHQQGLRTAQRFVNGKQQVGLVAGSCYQHQEEYAGPQGNWHWQGIVVLENVDNGSFDPHPVSLDQLCKRYEGHSLREHEGKVI